MVNRVVAQSTLRRLPINCDMALVDRRYPHSPLQVPSRSLCPCKETPHGTNEAKSDESLQKLSRDWKMLHDHHNRQILGDATVGTNNVNSIQNSSK